MKFKSTWIFAVLLVLIASYYFLVEVRRQEAEERETKMSKRLFPYDKDGIDRFVLINPQGDRIEIVKSDTGWKIISPVVTDASRATVDAILLQLLPGRKLDSFADVGNLGDYGLDTPFATAVFHGTNRMLADTIFVGDKTPMSPSCYVRIGSSDTVLVSREMTHNVLNKNLYHLRDKNFLHIGSEAIDSLRIEGDGRLLAFSQMDGLWWTGDPPVRVDRPLMGNYLSTLTLAIVRGFPAEDLSDLDRFGLARPSRKITLYCGHREIEISFGGLFEDQVHVVRTGLDKVLLLEQNVLEPFDWTMHDVVSRRLSFFESADVARIEIETPENRISIEKQPEGWRLGDAPVTRTKVQTFLRLLRTIRFESIIDRRIGDPFALPPPFSLRVSLEAEGGFTIERISFFRTDGTGERAASLSSDAFGRIGSGTIQDLEHRIDTH